MSGFGDQIDQSFYGVFPVACLMPVALGLDDDHATLSGPASSEGDQSFAHRLRERFRPHGIKPQVHRARHLINVLAARPGRPNKRNLKLFWVKLNLVGDINHGSFGIKYESPSL